MYGINNDNISRYFMSNMEHYEIETDYGPRWREIVHQYVGALKFGTVQITVHDSSVTQIEKTEKTRLDNPKTQTRQVGR
jgi:hypothetical protein